MTVKKTASKSEAKHVTAQKADKKPPHVSETDVLRDRLDALEAKVKILVDAQQFIANEARPVYGLGGMALIFDAIARKFK